MDSSVTHETEPKTKKQYIGYIIIAVAATLGLLSFFVNPLLVLAKIDYFPTANDPTNISMLLSTQGQLVIQGGTIRLAPFALGVVPFPVKSYLVIWPYGYSYRKSGVRIEILDEKGNVTARVGDFVTLDGGELPDNAAGTNFSPQLPNDKLRPVWLMGQIE